MIKIEKIIPGGYGLGSLDGKKGFFWNALPGEIVTEYRLAKQKSHYFEAVATKIDSPSSHRIKEKDPCYLSTSPWQIMNYDYELKQKQELVVEIFREHGIDIGVPEIITDGNDFYYRNKMEYSLYWNHETNQIDIGLHERGSHCKIPITKSSIERPEIFQKATEIVADLNARGEEARKYQSLLLRANQKGEISGGLYENHQPHPIFPPLTDTILGHQYSYSPNGFFQINLPVYELALKEIKKHITTDKVLDLYAGVGTIGLSVARDKHLTLVEVDKSAFTEMINNVNSVSKTPVQYSEDAVGGCYQVAVGVESAESLLSAPKRRPANDSESRDSRSAPPVKTGGRDSVSEEYCTGVLAKSEECLNYIEPDQTVILDPPRAGCDHKLINKLLEVTPLRIIYLSCNPATQARDTKLLLEKYQISEVKTFNFFPRTPHIENLIILDKIS